MGMKFVAHTSASMTVDGKSGKNNRLERGTSVVDNHVAPGGSQKASLRAEGPTGSDGGGDKGRGVVIRETPMNQHGTTGTVQPASKQP